MQEAVIAGFAHPAQGELLTGYVQRYFAEVSEVWQRRTSELAQNIVVRLFPTWSTTISQRHGRQGRRVPRAGRSADVTAATGRRGAGRTSSRALRARQALPAERLTA